MIFTFAASKASFINDDWELVERMIDFIVLDDDDHKGQEAAKAFMKSAAKRGALKQISITFITCCPKCRTLSERYNNVLIVTLVSLLGKHDHG